jgi:hypothetical protein
MFHFLLGQDTRSTAHFSQEPAAGLCGWELTPSTTESYRQHRCSNPKRPFAHRQFGFVAQRVEPRRRVRRTLRPSLLQRGLIRLSSAEQRRRTRFGAPIICCVQPAAWVHGRGRSAFANLRGDFVNAEPAAGERPNHVSMDDGSLSSRISDLRRYHGVLMRRPPTSSKARTP